MYPAAQVTLQLVEPAERLVHLETSTLAFRGASGGHVEEAGGGSHLVSLFSSSFEAKSALCFVLCEQTSQGKGMARMAPPICFYRLRHRPHGILSEYRNVFSEKHRLPSVVLF